jgi:beta-lactamase class A
MRRLLIGVLATLLMTAAPSMALPAAAAAPAPGTVAAPPIPDTPVGRQLAWLIQASRRLPLSEAELRAHIEPGALTAAGGPAGMNGALASVASRTGLRLHRITQATATTMTAIVTGGSEDWLTFLAVGGDGLVSGLQFVRYLPAPTSWAELDRRLGALAPRVSFLAAEVGPGGRCVPVHGLEPTVQRPLGSAFKLYVLGALARAVRTGRASWDQQLAIRDDWKSRPSGVLQDLPAGTRLPLRSYADQMIAISDNTAADHLIHRLGRSDVEAQQVRFGMRRPDLNRPFLLTRELFVLKGARYPRLADSYQRLPRPRRGAYLTGVVDRVPLSEVSAWQSPRAIDTIEWFGSPMDICEAFAGLRRQSAAPGGAPVAAALSRNDGGIGLDRSRWPTVWYKGGSEPGVLTLNYLARATDGRTFVVSAMLGDPRQPIRDTAGPEVQALIRGAFQLAQRQRAGAVQPSRAACRCSNTRNPCLGRKVCSATSP